MPWLATMMFSANEPCQRRLFASTKYMKRTVSHGGNVGSSSDTDTVNHGDLPVRRKFVQRRAAERDETQLHTGWREPTSEPLKFKQGQLGSSVEVVAGSLLKKMRPKCSRSGKTFA